MYKILVVSLPGSPKREAMSARLLEQGLAWEWVDGVRLEAVEEAAPEEYSDLEAYRIPRLKTDPDYIRRAVGCKRAMRNALAWAACCEEEWVVILQDDTRVTDKLNGKVPPSLLSKILRGQIDAVMGIGMVKGRRPRGQGTVRQRCSMRWAPPQIRRIFQFFFVVWFTPPHASIFGREGKKHEMLLKRHETATKEHERRGH